MRYVLIAVFSAACGWYMAASFHCILNASIRVALKELRAKSLEEEQVRRLVLPPKGEE